MVRRWMLQGRRRKRSLMAYYTDPSTGTTYTSPEVAKQYGVNVPSSVPASSTTIQQQTAAANQASPTLNAGGNYNPPAGTQVNPTGQFTPGGVATPEAIPQQNSAPLNINTPQIQPPTPQVNTSQPNPSTVQVQPGSNAISGNIAPLPSVSPTTSASGQANAGLTAAQASGAAPQNAGAGRSGVQKFTPPSAQPNPVSGAESLLAQSPEYAKWLADVTELNSSQNQSKSLLDFYSQATKEAGIPAINMELVNMKSVIDGTEDDVRKEVQAAGGFATESQVLALSSARNKTLIKNYNTLLDTKKMAQEQINNMVNLASQDRTYAMDAINQKLQIDSQALEIKSKMISAAQEGYNNVIKSVGYTGLLQMLGNDPDSISMAEQTLGFAPGGLNQISNYTQNQSNLKNLADYNITSPYVVTASGEVQNTQTGQGYSDPQQFQQATGMTLDQAGAKGLIKPLGQTKEDKQQSFDNAVKLEGLNIQKQQQSISAGNLGLAREKFQYDQIKDALDAGKLDDATVGKIQASPDYKTISGLLPAVQAIKKYSDLIKENGTYANPITKGKERGELDSAYGNAIAAWKTLAGLGALSGADFELAENAIPKNGFFVNDAKALGSLQTSLDNAVVQAENLTKRLTSLYPKGNEILQAQLDDILVNAHPEKYKVGPDGKVYEITP